MRYDGLGLVGCITEAGPVLRSLALSTTAYNTSESIVTEINVCNHFTMHLLILMYNVWQLLVSPLILYPVSMAPAPEDHQSPSFSGSSRGMPTYNAVDLPPTPSASKGHSGCWWALHHNLLHAKLIDNRTCHLCRKVCYYYTTWLYRHTSIS